MRQCRTDAAAGSPSNYLASAANDSCMCLWDLLLVDNATDGMPKLVSKTSKSLHSTGIFAMDVNVSKMIGTGSKDKTVVASTVLSTG
jgi:WD40 repeat protein